MIYLYLFGTCFHFIYVFMIIGNNDIVTTGNFNDGTLKQLQHTLWKGYDSKPSNLDNRALVSDTKHVNTTIAQAYINNHT